MITQVRQKASDTSNRQWFSVPSVLRLLGKALPFAVGFTIPLIIVNSAKCFSCWSDPHVGQKVGEFIPTDINCNTSASIVRIADVIGIKAALFHVCPRFKSGSMPHSVNPVSAFHTAFCSARSEQRVAADGFVSTITKAYAVIFAVGITDHQKLAEPLVNQRRSFLWHNSVPALLCFRGGPWSRFQGPLLSKYETGGAIYQG